ncbi:hypothetical protein V1264_023485 [Littorina saxatilis]|uniref:EGF-like domain-containing protein n=2 Tax=Littorina saxatilis TaxID=31220 RepID=A0AAN9B755_9CAEN
MKLLFFALISLFASKAKCHQGSVCDMLCTGQAGQPSHVVNYCKVSAMNLTKNQRCCVNSTKGNFTDTDVMGVDLRNCSLQNITGFFKDMTSLVVITLDDNPDLESVAADEFYHLTSLDYLTLPSDKKKPEECPGGIMAWKERDFVNNSLVCQHQANNTCFNIENNATCPSPQSYCVPAGPGLVDCLCSPGYHGYKCLRQGTFPLVPFIGGLCGSTVVLAGFLWVTQRRHVKKQS